MIFTDKEVWEEVRIQARRFELDPYLVMAINEQECEHRIGKRGSRVFDITKYDCSVPRLEQNFYERYTRDFEYPTTVEGMLAWSYGCMQMMGESLRKCLNDEKQNYYEWFFSSMQKQEQDYFREPMSPVCVVKALDFYCTNLSVMVEWGCRWYCAKLAKANLNTLKALIYWNGSEKYPSEVLDRVPRLQKVHKL